MIVMNPYRCAITMMIRVTGDLPQFRTPSEQFYIQDGKDIHYIRWFLHIRTAGDAASMKRLWLWLVARSAAITSLGCV